MTCRAPLSYTLVLRASTASICVSTNNVFAGVGQGPCLRGSEVLEAGTGDVCIAFCDVHQQRAGLARWGNVRVQHCGKAKLLLA